VHTLESTALTAPCYALQTQVTLSSVHESYILEASWDYSVRTNSAYLWLYPCRRAMSKLSGRLIPEIYETPGSLGYLASCRLDKIQQPNNQCT
jgi:hypothetical protein